MNLEACLPAELRGASIEPIAAGMSGAGVYRVGTAHVLKISDPAEPLDAWQRKAQIQTDAAAAGIAPTIVHTDESRRAVVSELVVDRGFPMWFGNPETRATAIATLGRTLRKIHELPIPEGAVASDPRGLLAKLAAALDGFPVPAVVGEAIARVQSDTPPDSHRAIVLSHNDVNPTNLVFDGERLLLLDWETAAPNDPFYDLAAISVLLRMDLPTCLELLAAHDGVASEVLPARFAYDRREIAALIGCALLGLARRFGHPGDRAGTSGGLAEFYPRMRAGLDIRSAEGQWAFGLALITDSLVL
ncbi:MAG: phosphotransferase [Kofleriaceae bacterium]